MSEPSEASDRAVPVPVAVGGSMGGSPSSLRRSSLCLNLCSSSGTDSVLQPSTSRASGRDVGDRRFFAVDRRRFSRSSRSSSALSMAISARSLCTSICSGVGCEAAMARACAATFLSRVRGVDGVIGGVDGTFTRLDIPAAGTEWKAPPKKNLMPSTLPRAAQKLASGVRKKFEAGVITAGLAVL